MTYAGSSLRLLAWILPVCVLLTGGCAGSRSVKGKVVLGPAGIATLVAQNDPRLAETGAPGVRVRIADGEGPGSIAEATSSGDGSFSVRIPDALMTRRLNVHATGDGILPLHASSYLPGDDRRLLVIVESTSSMEGGGR